MFRFAPSPNGRLHLGHAYSALLNERMAKAVGGRFLLRIEDIDLQRCSDANIAHLMDDLDWLGLRFEKNVRRQSQHFADYRAAIDTLVDAGIAYRSQLSRGDIARIVEAEEAAGKVWTRDPDGVPLFPGQAYEPEKIDLQQPYAIRLNMQAALKHCNQELGFEETGSGHDGESGWLMADPSLWGDIVLARKDTPTSYHISVVIDDALQGVTHVVRGVDLFAATSVHVLLQALFGLPQPIYHHHRLVTGDDGMKLAKSRRDTSLAELRAVGVTPQDIIRMVGLDRE